ncbi:MAG TPA: 7-cyano-7-deazaguanine synthase QueC [Terriglobales bacterium]|nr:7-cyano-7-deazaguanine synthase QueC [Terriglobales bacterium]
MSGPGKPGAVVLVSGGMDSCVCAALAARDYSPAFLHFDYGQRTARRERRAFEAIADFYRVERRLVVESGLFRQIGGSALTDASLAVPEGGVDADVIPITYVPFRNAHLLAAGVSWAEVLGTEVVMIGAVANDSSGYPDCRPEYYEAFNHLLEVGTRDGRVRVATPLLTRSKAEIVELGLELGAPFQLSWSCYQNSDEACGRCDSCRLRLRAFGQAGAHDPIAYATKERT